MTKKQGRQDTPVEEPAQSTLREYFLTTVVCTIFALFVTTYVVHPMTVPTPSMEPTIMVGDRLLIDKFTVRNGFLEAGLPVSPVHSVERGDILVFKFPEDPEVLYVKRLIGLPGETIAIQDKQVYINGQPLDEPYKHHSDSMTYQRRRLPHGFMGDFQRDNYGPVQIPADHFFMMGDNRDNSADSRYWSFLPKSYVVGRPLLVFWSYQDDPTAHTRTDYIQLYAERVIHFFSKTRWSRTFHFIR